MQKRFLINSGFTLAETLITLAIIGVVAALTIPSVVRNVQNQAIVASLLKFNQNLQQAVMMWKQNMGCTGDAYTCLAEQNLADNDTRNFDQIAQFLRYNKKLNRSQDATNANWLPEQTLAYNGSVVTVDIDPMVCYFGVSKKGYCRVRYALVSGENISVDNDATGCWLLVDVNGKKPPNRIGKDTFPFAIGYVRGKDVYYYGRSSQVGICGVESGVCTPHNLDSTKSGGASPTAYVILNKKPIDFSAL